MPIILTRCLSSLVSILIGQGSGLHMVCAAVLPAGASATRSVAMAPPIKVDHGLPRVTGDVEWWALRGVTITQSS